MKYLEEVPSSTILFPRADGEGALILTAYPEGTTVTDGPTGEILSDTYRAVQQIEESE
ncbi:MAG TPA: hypothetical protein VJP80_04220 [Candidatus Saccharimonadales bacterium]|nr:hypothetical protein [Candidatus Saccharimonadales bacterium]